MNKDVFDAIVGKKGNIANAMKDSDGDGVGNLIDCRPYDPKKQGWIHDAVSKVKEKVGEKVAEYKEESAIRKEAAKQERKVQIAETAKYREQQRAGAERARIKARYSGKSSGGGFSSLMSGLSNVSNAMVGTTKTTTPKAGKRKVVTYVKKGKHYVKKTSYRPVKTGGAGNASNNVRQFPDIMGVGNGKSSTPRVFNKGWI